MATKPRAATKKTTSESPSDTIPGRNGGRLRRGGTNKGGPGRPPNAFKDFLAKLRKDPDFQREIEKAAKDRECRGFNAALKLVTDYDDEKPAEKKELSGKVEVTVRVAREGRRVTAG